MALAILISAFLLFQIQPMIAKYILPWFGGASTVWTISMLFFQAVLLLGYGYSHFVVRFLKLKHQPVLHGIVLIIAFAFLPMSPDQYLSEGSSNNPILNILILLSLAIGYPYFLLTTTSSLIQSWYGKLNPDRSPYPLYALSNFGSLAALLSYPFFFEIRLALQDQTYYWSVTMMVLIVLMICNCLYFYIKCGRENLKTDETKESTKHSSPFMWFCWSSVASVLLLATSDYLSRDVASVPLLWVVPLSLYLLTFILCFESQRWYKRAVFLPLFFLLIAVAIFEQTKLVELTYVLQIVLYNLTLFLACMLCHGELIKLKPDVDHLTKFYLFVSIGGVSGGVFIGLVAPVLFQVPIDIHIGYLFLVVLLTVMTLKKPEAINRIFSVRVMGACVLLYFVLIGSYYNNYTSAAVDISRNFYGSVRVLDEQAGSDQIRSLAHGTTGHGIEIVGDDPDNLKATAYYGIFSGVGQAIQLFDDKPLNMGMVGLGIGTVATYLKPSDHLEVYEINPQVTEFANSYFNYLKNTRGTVNVKHGDGRLLLNADENKNFDILAVDAFSGDSIPVHLLTNDAMDIYKKHLSQDGILAFHTSNNYLDLRPVLYGLADKADMFVVEILDRGNISSHTKQSQWFLLTRDEMTFEELRLFSSIVEKPQDLQPIYWTDTSSNIFSILK
ncbi:spermidine synthase [Pseudemcibacter aquimaris]|uniref:spermidine synthase n=1 Tax=Pseudemcibacter aquimaris TaxID=2857064 RepID=UPI002011159D|nr:fused MFS/spermidine synthase [Pseudemcibacter aquimaris]MCC3862338.1 fused MFS/spermidine synthase [Pseudemcibacter aquimaris]WDU59231.1 fused MFS/spermidine synthase [Pseudemcibacter aquimaris]